MQLDYNESNHTVYDRGGELYAGFRHFVILCTTYCLNDCFGRNGLNGRMYSGDATFSVEGLQDLQKKAKL